MMIYEAKIKNTENIPVITYFSEINLPNKQLQFATELI